MPTKQQVDELNRNHMCTACNLWACIDQPSKSCCTAAHVITDGSIIISARYKLWFILAFVFVGCNHVTAWLILMSAHICPASCLHFRTSLRSITANRWVHLLWSRHTVWKCWMSWIYVMPYCTLSSVFFINVSSTECTTFRSVSDAFNCVCCLHVIMNV